MSTDIVMPNLGFDTQEGRLIEWLKQPGEAVKRGEVIAVIESDKANVELESIASGTLLEHLAAPDEIVAVGAVIARIGEAETVTQVQTQSAPAQSQAAPVQATKAPNFAPEISPVARRMAQENQIDLSGVQGSGPRGRITREDVEALIRPAPSNGGSAKPLALPKVRQAARQAGINLAEVPATGAQGQVTLANLQAYQAQPSAPEKISAPVGAAVAEPPQESSAVAISAPTSAREISLSRLRQLAGKRLSESKRAAPHFYVTAEFDLEAALKRLESLPAPQPKLNDLVQYLTVQTLLRVPELNATLEDERLFYHDNVNLAIAVSRDDGLITPVLRGAERFSLSGLAAESRALIKRTRDNRLQPDDLQNGTFTISNLGVIPQVEQFTAVINPPQVGILAVGTIKARPVVMNGGLHIRHTVKATLSGDHRAVDGMDLGRFMAAFQAELERFSA